MSFKSKEKQLKIPNQKQRDAIAILQEAVLDNISSHHVSSVIRYENIPSMAMEVDATGLEMLLNSPEVAGVAEARILSLPPSPTIPTQ